MIQSCTQQEKATAASLRVAWILPKKKRPFTESETIKECMLVVLEEVVRDKKMKSEVIESVEQVPISDTSTMRRVELLGIHVFENLLVSLKKAEFISLAIDESTDIRDTAQLCIYVRFFVINLSTKNCLH